MPVRKKRQPPTYDELSKLTNAAVRAGIASLQDEFDNKLINTIETGGACIGIPLPSLAFEWLVDTTIWPLGRVIQCNGLQASMKSAFAFEMSRIFRKYAGITHYHETEGKFAEVLCRSIIGWGADTAFVRDPCESMNDWQSKLIASMKYVKRAMDGNGRKQPGLGRIFPVLEVIDSLTAKNMDTSDERIEKAGFAQSSHPVEAGSITKFMKFVQKTLDHYPIALLLINHLKIQGDPGNPAQQIRHTPGGKHVAFAETIELEFAKRAKIELKDKEGLLINIRCRKNSLGTFDHRITVPVRWWYAMTQDASAGKREVLRQRTVWDWHEATTMLLTDANFRLRATVRDILDIQEVRSGGKRYASKRLRIRKDAAVTAHAFGKAICSNSEVLAELRAAMGIKCRPALDPSLGYAKQQATARALIDEYTEKQDDELPAEKVKVRSRVTSSEAADGRDGEQPKRSRKSTRTPSS